MQTLRGEYYLKRDFGFYDAGILPVVGFTLPWVYDVLRRFVWRSLQTGDPEMRALYAEGLLAAKVRQQVIGAYLGMSRQTICSYVGQLRALGWLRSVELKSTYGMSAYVLGEVLRDGNGGAHEVFYADAFLRDLWDTLCTAAIEIHGNGATPMDLAMEERVKRVRAVMAPLLAKAETPSPDADSEGGTSQASLTPPVKLGRHPLSSTPDTPCQAGFTLEEKRNLKGANKEEKETNMPLSRQVCVPSLHPIEAVPFYAPEETENFEEQVQSIKAAQIQRTTELVAAASEKEAKQSNFKGKEPPVRHRKVLGDLASYWHERMVQRFPNVKISPWESRGKEYKQLQQLVEKYDATIVRDGITYVLTNWDRLRERIFKGQGTAPTIGMLLKLHDSLLLESQQYAAAQKIVVGVNAILDKDAYATLPEVLDAQYKQARSDLKAMGVDI